MTRWLAAAAAAILLSGCASLPKAARHGDLGAVNEYLAKGGSANARFDDSGGCTLLHPAAEGGHVAVVQALLDHGADPNAVGPSGYTPLHIASGGQWPEVARLLLSRGARPSLTMRDEWSNTPLLLAVSVVKNTSKTVITSYGAAFGGESAPEPSAELIEALLDAGADVNLPTAKGNTPLHLAAYKGYVRTVRLLLAKGADRTARNGQGETPEALARRYSQAAVVAVLRGP